MRHHLQLTESEITPIGIGWWLDSGIPTDSIKASSFRLGPADKDQLNQLTQKSPDSTIHSASCATTANGEICAVLTEYQLPKKYRKAQFYKNTNGVWESVKEDIAYDGDLQVIHDYEGQSCGIQFNGKFYFLPDLDQDGYPELFFQNTVSSIGSITTEKDTDTLKIITLKHIYRGP